MVMIDKKDKYDTLCAQIQCLSEGENNVIGVLSNVSAAMHETFPESYFWVGFYLVNGDELLLGPFQGSVACYRIKKVVEYVERLGQKTQQSSLMMLMHFQVI